MNSNLTLSELYKYHTVYVSNSYLLWGKPSKPQWSRFPRSSLRTSQTPGFASFEPPFSYSLIRLPSERRDTKAKKHARSDLLVKLSHRVSWGILPQTPVFSLRLARCYWESSHSWSAFY